MLTGSTVTPAGLKSTASKIMMPGLSPRYSTSLGWWHEQLDTGQACCLWARAQARHYATRHLGDGPDANTPLAALDQPRSTVFGPGASHALSWCQRQVASPVDLLRARH